MTQTQALAEEIQAQGQIRQWMDNWGISSRHEGFYMDLWRCRRAECANCFALYDVLEKVITDSKRSDDPDIDPVSLHIEIEPEQGGEFWSAAPPVQNADSPKRFIPSWLIALAWFAVGLFVGIAATH